MISFHKLTSITRDFQALPVPLDVLQTNGTPPTGPNLVRQESSFPESMSCHYSPMKLLDRYATSEVGTGTAAARTTPTVKPVRTALPLGMSMSNSEATRFELMPGRVRA